MTDLLYIYIYIIALAQAFSMGTIAYLFNSSATFYMGTRYNFSFVLCIISWIMSILLAIVLSLVAVLSPPEYAYQQLD
jgi:ABC-type dipeptide/oligopeptide/nickel transport system permease component